MENKHYETIQKEVRLRRIDSILNYKGFSEAERDLIKRYYGTLQRKGLRLESQRNYLQSFKILLKKFKELGINFKKATREDINRYLVNLDNDLKPRTVFERRQFLLRIYCWFYDKKKEEIDLIKDVKLKKGIGTVLPEEILSPEEVKQMVQVADNFRDKAIVILLYETGARKGEFLQLKIKHLDITNQKYGHITIPKGKTDSRKLPIIYSIPHIQNLLNSHPDRNNPNSPLFLNFGAWLGRALGDDGLKRMIKILGKRAGIKKKIYPHLFRHSRMTELAKVLKEQELKIFAGWTPNSNMASVYVHLSGSDVSNKILANAGLIDSGEYKVEKDILQGVVCPRCSKVNPADSKYCSCGFIVDLKEVNKVMEQEHSSKERLVSLLESSQMKNLLKVLHKYQKELEQES